LYYHLHIDTRRRVFFVSPNAQVQMRWRGLPLAALAALALRAEQALAVHIELRQGARPRIDNDRAISDTDPKDGLSEEFESIEARTSPAIFTRLRLAHSPAISSSRNTSDLLVYPNRLSIELPTTDLLAGSALSTGPANYRLVGLLCRTYLGRHLFTVAVYLSVTSPCWGRTYNDSNINQLLADSVGNYLLRFRLHKGVTRRLFNSFAIQPIRPHLRSRNASAIIGEYRRGVMSGPEFNEGTVVDVVSTPDGLRYIVDSQTVASNLGNQNLSLAALGWLVEADAQIPEFRTVLLDNIAQGLNVTVTLLWAGSVNDRIPSRVIVIIVVIALVVAGLLFLSCWFVWRRFRRNTSGAPAAGQGGAKRPLGAAALRPGQRFAAGMPRSPAVPAK
jgi:hypothetical protein